MSLLNMPFLGQRHRRVGHAETEKEEKKENWGLSANRGELK